MAIAGEIDNAGPVLVIIGSIAVVLCVITTALRCWVRYTRHFLGPDDYTIAAATLLAVARVAIQYVSVQRGNGRHRISLSKEDYAQVNFYTWLTQLLLFPLLGLLKLSVCTLVLRIKNTPALRHFLWVVMAGLVISTLLPEIVLLAECRPLSAYWMPQPQYCWRPEVRIYSIYVQTGNLIANYRV